MFDGITVQAPAKINLGLKVYPRRADGFHDIESIFTTVNLCDTLKVSSWQNDGECVVECDQMNLPGENTITKAYKAFCVLTGIRKGVRVNLIKRIPAGGGLGGGSSDASSFIQSIDTIFSTHLSSSDMMQIASQVGSDVFFFTRALQEQKVPSEGFSGFAALVKGRGEKITALPYRGDYKLLLLFPQTGVSTKEAYGLVDLWAKNMPDLEKLHNEVDLEEEWKKKGLDWNFVNDFTEPVCSKYPDLFQALKDIKETEPDFSDMTGSGSTLYGVYGDVNSARMAYEKLSRKWKVVLV